VEIQSDPRYFPSQLFGKSPISHGAFTLPEYLSYTLIYMKTIYTIGEDKKTLIAERSFTAPLEKVWLAWTDSDLLEKWWAPAPWMARTKSFEFKEGGALLYGRTRGRKALVP
jgi:Activator of Hsp90 ATPase homolog 1-like protein